MTFASVRPCTLKGKVFTVAALNTFAVSRIFRMALTQTLAQVWRRNYQVDEIKFFTRYLCDFMAQKLLP